MARLSSPWIITVAVVFFSFTLSRARIPVSIPGDEVPSSLPESDVDPIIRLPSAAEVQSNEPIRETQESEPSTVQTLPRLRVVRFRPVDHQIRLRSRFPFRCRHYHHRHNRFFMPLGQRPEIPYGNDMVITKGENGDFDPGMFHGGVRRIPARWVKFHHHHHHDDDEDDDDKLKKHKHHHHHHDDDEKHHEKKKGGGFMMHIRKILDNF